MANGEGGTGAGGHRREVGHVLDDRQPDPPALHGGLAGDSSQTGAMTGHPSRIPVHDRTRSHERDETVDSLFGELLGHELGPASLGEGEGDGELWGWLWFPPYLTHRLQDGTEPTEAPSACSVRDRELGSWSQAQHPFQVTAVVSLQLGSLEVGHEGVRSRRRIGQRAEHYLKADRMRARRRVSGGATSSPRSAANRRKSSSCSGVRPVGVSTITCTSTSPRPRPST